MSRHVDLPLARLDDELRGAVLGPDDDGYDQARAAFNLAVDQQPAAVALVHEAADVQGVVRFAAEHGLRVAVQGTGHGATCVPGLAGTILVRTAALAEVSVDAAARVARVAGGARWRDVAAVAAQAGLVGLAGTSSGVGVAGYTLGGGAGWLVRRHGLAAWMLRAADVVTADGEALHVDADSHPELLWALRGAGSAPAAVTALELDLQPLGEVYAGGLWWPIERAPEVFAAWADWLQGVDDDVTSLVRVLRLPPLPVVPEPLRGRAFAVIEAAILGDAGAAAARMEPLRALGPEIDRMATIPAPALAEVHGDPQDPVPSAGAGVLLRELPVTALEALDGAAGAESGTSLISVEVRHLAGAAGRQAPVDSVLERVAEPFALFGVGMAGDPDSQATTEASLAVLRDALAPWSSQRTLPTLADGPIDPEAGFGAAAAARLRAVEARYDPDGRFLLNRPPG